MAGTSTVTSDPKDAVYADKGPIYRHIWRTLGAAKASEALDKGWVCGWHRPRGDSLAFRDEAFEAACAVCDRYFTYVIVPCGSAVCAVPLIPEALTVKARAAGCRHIDVEKLRSVLEREIPASLVKASTELTPSLRQKIFGRQIEAA